MTTNELRRCGRIPGFTGSRDWLLGGYEVLRVARKMYINALGTDECFRAHYNYKFLRQCVLGF